MRAKTVVEARMHKGIGDAVKRRVSLRKIEIVNPVTNGEPISAAKRDNDCKHHILGASQNKENEKASLSW